MDSIAQPKPNLGGNLLKNATRITENPDEILGLCS